MRHELGLDLPERRIGLSAHDFAQLLGARRRDPHPFGQGRRRAGGRLALPAPAGSGRRRRALGSGESAPAKNMSASPTSSTSPTKVKPIAQPAPKPPRATRPLKLSVTAIEDWLRDPYTIYARYILQARAARSRRHAAVGGRSRLGDPRCARRIHARPSPTRCRDDPARVLREHRRKIFRAADGAAGGARAVVAAVSAHRRLVCRLGSSRGAAISPTIDAEIRGEIAIPLDNERIFMLSARADRIERRARRQLCDPRLQDRAAADRQAGAHGTVAAADAGGGDPARGRL